MFKMFYMLSRAIKEEKKNEEGVDSLESRESARFGNLKLGKKTASERRIV